MKREEKCRLLVIIPNYNMGKDMLVLYLLQLSFLR